jgi:hypothetical protein
VNAEWQPTVDRLVASAEAQGFTRHCTDPAILAVVADVLRQAEGARGLDAAERPRALAAGLALK